MRVLTRLVWGVRGIVVDEEGKGLLKVSLTALVAYKPYSYIRLKLGTPLSGSGRVPRIFLIKEARYLELIVLLCISEYVVGVVGVEIVYLALSISRDKGVPTGRCTLGRAVGVVSCARILAIFRYLVTLTVKIRTRVFKMPFANVAYAISVIREHVGEGGDILTQLVGTVRAAVLPHPVIRRITT